MRTTRRTNGSAAPVAGKRATAAASSAPAGRDAPQDLVGSGEFAQWKLPGLDYPSFRLGLVAKIMDRLSCRQLAGLGNLSFAEWRVLSRLAISRGGLTVKQLAERAWVDRAEVSRAAAALEARGLTGRRENPEDGRTPVLYATEEGLAFYQPVMRARRRFHASVIKGLSNAELERLDELLIKLARTLLRMSAVNPS